MHEIKSYGIHLNETPASTVTSAVEKIKYNGYAIISGILSSSQLAEARLRLDSVYSQQEAAFGKENIIRIDEQDTARALLAYDEFFLEIATQNTILALVRKIIGDYVVLHLQNGILCRPGQPHHQASWHRDLPYQEFTISKPLAISALFALDAFTQQSGATWLIPSSHLYATPPSIDFIEEFKIPAVAEPGSVIVFDSMLLHCTGNNSGDFVRRAVNNMYTVPILSQQISLPQSLKGKYSDSKELRQLLGYDSECASSVGDWRARRLQRSQSRGVNINSVY